MARGKFVVVEGPDGSGKSSLAIALSKRLTTLGQKSIAVREPGGCAMSTHIRELVLDTKMASLNANSKMMMMFAARLQLCREVISPALNNGYDVICDRFSVSTYIYQVLLELGDADLLWELAVYTPNVDNLILLHCPFETSYTRTLSRDQKDRNAYDDISLGKRKIIWEAYAELDDRTAKKCVGNNASVMRLNTDHYTTDDLVDLLMSNIWNFY